MADNMEARAAALGKVAEAPSAEPTAAPEAQGPIPVDEVIKAMEMLRPQAKDPQKFQEALDLLAESLGGPAEQSAEQTPMSEEV